MWTAGRHESCHTSELSRVQYCAGAVFPILQLLITTTRSDLWQGVSPLSRTRRQMKERCCFRRKIASLTCCFPKHGSPC